MQDRLRRVGKDLYAWLENGAYLYVCGDAERMAPDVNAALVDVVATHGRAFWILDDLSPVRQYNDDIAKSDMHLYTPAPAIRKALVYGSVVASYGCEGFSLDRLKKLSRREIEARAAGFRRMARVI